MISCQNMIHSQGSRVPSPTPTGVNGKPPTVFASALVNTTLPSGANIPSCYSEDKQEPLGQIGRSRWGIGRKDLFEEGWLEE